MTPKKPAAPKKPEVNHNVGDFPDKPKTGNLSRYQFRLYLRGLAESIRAGKSSYDHWQEVPNDLLMKGVEKWTDSEIYNDMARVFEDMRAENLKMKNEIAKLTLKLNSAIDSKVQASEALHTMQARNHDVIAALRGIILDALNRPR